MLCKGDKATLEKNIRMRRERCEILKPFVDHISLAFSIKLHGQWPHRYIQARILYAEEYTASGHSDINKQEYLYTEESTNVISKTGQGTYILRLLC